MQKIVIIAIIFLALLGGASLVSQSTRTGTQPAPTSPPQPSVTPGQTITLTGTLDCMPYKTSGGIQLMSCAMGLKATDGSFWALNNIQDALIKGTMSSGNTITVTGTAAAYEGPLQVAGTIYVLRIEGLNTPSKP